MQKQSFQQVVKDGNGQQWPNCRALNTAKVEQNRDLGRRYDGAKAWQPEGTMKTWVPEPRGHSGNTKGILEAKAKTPGLGKPEAKRN